MTGFLYLTFLFMTQCGCGFGSHVLQLESTVRVRLGLPTRLECHVLVDGHFVIFWIKIPLNDAPVCIASAKAFMEKVDMCKQFENHSRIKVTWNKKTFNLSFSSVEQTDIATYACGTYTIGQFFFGNGSKLVVDKHADVISPNTTIKDVYKKDGKNQVFKYLAAALAATNVASIILIISLCHCLKKNRTGVINEVSPEGDNKTDEVNYAALNFGHKQRRTVQKRSNANTNVIYGAVRHQEEL